jgi:CHAT domain-containing protein
MAFLGLGDPDTRRASSSHARTEAMLENLERPDARQLAALPLLPETADELRLTAAAFNGDRHDRAGQCHVCVGAEATEARIRKMSQSGELKRFGAISFATHGLVAGDIPGLAEAALVLTPGNVDAAADDGVLTASDVAELDLAAELVLLTACNTGVAKQGHDKAGLSDLASAFIYAGAKSVLVSHWPVDSRATAHLAATAAQKFRESPQDGFEQALRQTMLEMIDGDADEKWADPFYWAPFTLVQASRSR